MKQTPVIVLLCACLAAAALSSCKSPGKPTVPTAETTVSAEYTAIPAAGNPAQGYYQVFLRLWRSNSALHYDIKNLALDLDECKLEDTAPLIALFEQYCDDNGLKLMFGNFESLSAQGLISKEWLYWKDGVIVSFIDKALSASRLVTEAKLWRSGTGAIGIKYTAKRGRDGWQVTDEKMLWIS